jgi:Fe-S-cluster containining protein
MEKILAFVRAMPQVERERLAKQKRRPIDCGFLDMESSRCAIYSVRPWICEAFGRVKGMQCPKLSGLVQILPPFLEDTGEDAEYESGIVGNSSEIDWRKF